LGESPDCELAACELAACELAACELAACELAASELAVWLAIAAFEVLAAPAWLGLEASADGDG
jgi:hypothetical protein